MPPVPVAERPVVAPAQSEAEPARTSSTLLLAGGLLLGVGGIITMLSRRSRNDSVSIVDHDLPTISTRPPIVTHRSRTTEGLS